MKKPTTNQKLAASDPNVARKDGNVMHSDFKVSAHGKDQPSVFDYRNSKPNHG